MEVSDLLMLQSKIKQDSQGYKNDFIKYYQQYQSSLLLFKLQPEGDHREFGQLVKFIAHVAQFYPRVIGAFPTEISELLEQNAPVLVPKLRMTFVKSLILLRNRNLLAATSLLSLFFKLFRCKDKKLRTLLHNHIVSDVKKCNEGKRNNVLNNKLQSFMYTMLQDESAISPRESLKVMIELYRKNIWNDQKTVNAISTGMFSSDSKLIAIVLNFFLSAPGIDPDENLIEKANKMKYEAEKKFGHNYAGKTKKRKRKLEEAIKVSKKFRNKAKESYYDEGRNFNFAAMNLIHDPQHYVQKVFQVLKKCNHGFELKIRIMSFISRLIAVHELILESFYSFMQKYCQPHQQYVTQLLAIFATACHTMVSPDILETPIRSIANSFVSDRRTNEVVALGLNSIREICLRCPLAMNETLLKDLIQYKKSKDKGVMMAARSLLGVYRVVNPALLPRKERGKFADVTVKPLRYGEREVTRIIQGTEYLISDSENSSEEDVWEEISGSEDSAADSLSATSVTESMTNRAEGHRLLSQHEWEKLQDIQRDMVEQNPQNFGVKRRLEELYNVDLDDDIDPDDLRGPMKRQKATKDQRVQSAKDGVIEFQNDRKKGDHLSRTNIESQRNKAYSMVKHKKIRRNNRLSFQQRRKKKVKNSKKNHKKWH